MGVNLQQDSYPVKNLICRKVVNQILICFIDPAINMVL